MIGNMLANHVKCSVNIHKVQKVLHLAVDTVVQGGWENGWEKLLHDVVGGMIVIMFPRSSQKLRLNI